MLTLSNPWHKMFIEADGKRFQVRHLCPSTDMANELCAADPTIAVIDVDEATGTTILADISPTVMPEPPKAADCPQCGFRVGQIPKAFQNKI